MSDLIASILVMALNTAVSGVIVWALFDVVVGDALKLPPIGFLQACGLVLLCGLLFKSNHSVTVKAPEEK